MVKLRRPARQIRHGFKCPNPYQLILEAQHILKRDDNVFNNDLKTASRKIIDTLNTNKGVQVFKQDTDKFATAQIHFKWFDTPVTLKIFVTASPKIQKQNGMDFINISDNDMEGYQNKDVFPEFAPLSCNSSVNQVISIFGMVSLYLVKHYSDFEEEFIGVIKHELLHALHYTKHPSLNINAGISYEFANDLINAYNAMDRAANLKFPTLSELDNITKYLKAHSNTLEHFHIVLILSACIYYLDDSESLAWIESFNGESLEIIRFNNYYPKAKLLTLYEECESYKIINTLYDFLLSYRRNIIDAVNSDRFLKQYIIRYFKICKQTSYPAQSIQDIPARRIQHILDSWKVKTQKFLYKVTVIHKQNVDEFSYPAK